MTLLTSLQSSRGGISSAYFVLFLTLFRPVFLLQTLIILSLSFLFISACLSIRFFTRDLVFISVVFIGRTRLSPIENSRIRWVTGLESSSLAEGFLLLLFPSSLNKQDDDDGGPGRT